MAAVALFVSLACGDSATQSAIDPFCSAAANRDDTGLERELGEFLDTLMPSDEEQRNFEKIRSWLAAKNCVTTVEIGDRIIETNPPIVTFEVAMDQAVTGALEIKLTFGDRFQFYDVKRPD